MESLINMNVLKQVGRMHMKGKNIKLTACKEDGV